MSTWIIENDAAKNPDGDPLDNLEIQSNSSGFQLINPNATVPNPSVLSTTTKTSAPFEFDNVSWDGQIWNVHVKAPLVDGQNGNGTWHLHGHGTKRTGGQDGDFTAQAGSGVGEEPGEAASYAKP
jgi:hypothetical protein